MINEKTSCTSQMCLYFCLVVVYKLRLFFSDFSSFFLLFFFFFCRRSQTKGVGNSWLHKNPHILQAYHSFFNINSKSNYFQFSLVVSTAFK